ncbi:MAG: MarR family winged helix-turn-helix transcriptional regulator [Pseudoclavibacter sp.]
MTDPAAARVPPGHDETPGDGWPDTGSPGDGCPDVDDPGAAHIPPGALTEPIAETIDPDDFMPRLVALLSNKLVWRESRLLRARFDLGTNDWRVISALALRPGSSLTTIAEYIAVNKAIISKSVTTLIARDLVVGSDAPGRSRPLYLTAAGADMHDRMLPLSLSGQEYVLEGLATERVTDLNTLLRELLARTDDEGFRNPSGL